ncbi:MAG: hypothetical protein QJR08_05220 [Bacillota bacterium]|nr:hypothetical protein [Bacillota bacterium]
MEMPALFPLGGWSAGAEPARLGPAVALGLLVALVVWATGRLLARSEACFHMRELGRIESLLDQELLVEHRWVTWVYAGLDDEGRALYRQVAREERFTGRLLRVEVGEAGGAEADGPPDASSLYGRRLILRFETDDGPRAVWVDGFGGVEAGGESLVVLQSGSDPFLLLLRRALPLAAAGERSGRPGA